MQRAAKLTFLSVGILMLAAALVTANRAHAANSTVQVAIDVNTSGNDDNVLGTTEACNVTPLQVGDTFDIDIVVRGVPTYEPPASGEVLGSNGIAGFEFNLLFDPAVLQVNKMQAFDGPTILKTTADPIQIVYLDYDGLRFPGREAAPGVTGNVRIDMLGLRSMNYASGDGVLTRVTLKAVGNGVSRLDLEDALLGSPLPTVFSAGLQYDAVMSTATVAVGNSSCASQTPGPFPSPTILPGPSPAITGRYTLTLEPATIPLNEDSVVTVKAFADSPGIAYMSIDIVWHNVQVVSCTGDVSCHQGGDFVEFFDGTGHVHVGDFTVGQVTVHPSGPAGTALEFGTIAIQDPNNSDLKGRLTIVNGQVIAIGPSPISTITPGATPSQTSTPPTSAPTPTVTPASLPRAGGPSVATGSASWPIAALLAGTVALGAAFVITRRTARR